MNSTTIAFAAVAATLFAVSVTSAATKTEAIDYKDGDTQLSGYLAYDDTATGSRPLVLVVHEWWGLNDYAKSRARQLAELGYVAFAVDMYGKGLVAKDAKQAGELATAMKSDRKAMRQRITAGLAAVRANPRVDGKRIAAIGYCFGGTVVLELARSGADIAAVVSFHGGLDSPTPDDAKNIKCKVLVCTGADDRSVPLAQVAAFEDEMRQAKVDYQVNIYGGAVHAFTNPASGDDPSKNVAYNPAADRRSWQAMKDFFIETIDPFRATSQPAWHAAIQPPKPLRGSSLFFHSPFEGVESVVFIVDSSGSMMAGGTFDYARADLKRAITSLRSDQKFNVIGFTDNRANPMKIKDKAGLQSATPENVKAAFAWIDQQVAGSETGITDPTEAIKLAFTVKPNLIVLLAGGDFDPAPGGNEGIKDLFKSLNKDKSVRVNTFSVADRKTDPPEPVLVDIARDNGGTCTGIYKGDLGRF